MLKQTLTYQDYNKVTRTENLYFNINKTELMENFDLMKEFGDLKEQIQGPERDLTTEEIQMLLSLVKKLILLSYGRRNDEGDEFWKSDEIFAKFQARATYDAFVMQLFMHPEQAIAFILGVMPEDLMDEATRMYEAENGPITTVELTQPPEGAVPGTVDGYSADGPEKEWYDYTRDELIAMDEFNFKRLFDGVKGTKPAMLLSVAMQRKNS